MSRDPPIHNFTSTNILKCIGSNGEGRQKQKQNWIIEMQWVCEKKLKRGREKGKNNRNKLVLCSALHV